MVLPPPMRGPFFAGPVKFFIPSVHLKDGFGLCLWSLFFFFWRAGPAGAGAHCGRASSGAGPRPGASVLVGGEEFSGARRGWVVLLVSVVAGLGFSLCVWGFWGFCGACA